MAHQLWLMHMQVSVPYLRSEYGKDYDFDAPVKLLDSMMHAMADQPNQQVVVLCQVSPPLSPLPLLRPVQVTVAYLRSQYGRDAVDGAQLPIKLLDLLGYGKAEQRDQQVVVLGQVKWLLLAAASQVAILFVDVLLGPPASAADSAVC